MSEADYLGVKLNVKADGLFQTYYELAPTTPPAGNRVAPVGAGFSQFGGMYRFTATFNDFEGGTGYQRSSSLSKFQSGVADVNFTEPKPTYIDSQNDIQYYTPTLNGFQFGITYTPNVAGQELVETSVRAETYDAASNIRYIYKGNNFGNLSITDMSYVDEYVNYLGLAPSLLPTQADVSSIRLSYSDKPEAATNHSLFRKYPLSEREGEISLVMGVNF